MTTIDTPALDTEEMDVGTGLYLYLTLLTATAPPHSLTHGTLRMVPFPLTSQVTRN